MEHRLRTVFAISLTALLILSVGTGGAAIARNERRAGPGQKGLTFPNNFQIKRVDEKWAMQDGTKLPVSVFFPVTGDKTLTFPMIVFVHPLGVDILTYENQARKYAAKGYVAVIYGFGGSFGAEGQFNMIDAAIDLPDLSRVITRASQDLRFPVLWDKKGTGGRCHRLLPGRRDSVPRCLQKEPQARRPG